MTHKILPHIIPVLIMISSCTHDDAYRRIQEADAIRVDNPDSALILLKAIEQSELRSEKVKAAYSLTTALTLNRLRLLHENDSILIPATEYYSSHGSDEQKMKLLYCQASISFHPEQAGKYVKKLTKVKKYAQELGNAHYIALSSHMLGNYFSKVADIPEEAKEQYFSALSHYHQDGIFKYDSHIYQQLSRIFIRQNNYSSADSLLKMAWHASKTYGDNKTERALHISEAYLHANKKPAEYDISLQHMRLAKKKGASFSSANYAFYAHLLSKNNLPDSVEYYIDIAFKKAKSQKDTITIYSYFENAFADAGKYDKAYPYLKSIYNYKDSIYRKQQEQSLVLEHRNFFLELAEEQEASAKKSKLQLNLTILSFIIALAFLSVFILLKKQQITKNIQALKDLTEVLFQEVGDKTKEIEDLRDKMKDHYKEHFRRLGQLVETTNTSRLEAEKISLGRKVSEITQEISNPESQKSLEAKLNEEVDNIMLHLREDLPKLKEKDFLFLAYMIIGFDVTQISVVLNKSLGSVYTKKFRLREKIAALNSPFEEQYRRWIW